MLFIVALGFLPSHQSIALSLALLFGVLALVGTLDFFQTKQAIRRNPFTDAY